MKRSIAVLGALGILLVGATTAHAGEATVTEPPSTEAPTTVTETVTEPTTETPVTTETPTTTETPATTTVPDTTTDIPVTTLGTTIDNGCEFDCIPTSEELVCEGAACIPGTVGAGGIPTAVGAGAALPFTGIEDAIAPLLLALTVVLGGVVAWRWAQLRESVAAAAARRAIVRADQPTNSGYASAARRLEIEDRARRVFTPRVA